MLKSWVWGTDRQICFPQDMSRHKTLKRLSTKLASFALIFNIFIGETLPPSLEISIPFPSTSQDLQLNQQLPLDNLIVQGSSLIRVIPPEYVTPVVKIEEEVSEPQPTPTPKPTPIPKPQPIIAPEHLEPLFNQYATHFHLDPNMLKAISNCESHHNPGAASGPYGGMYQFSASTWSSTRTTMGHDPNPDLRFNAEESIKTAAFKIANGGIRAWPTCARPYF